MMDDGSFEPDLKRAEALVTKMIALPGRSCQEGEIMAFVADRLREAGLPDTEMRFDQAHRRSPLGGEVGNLVVRLKGTVRGPRRMLMAHVDTVPICVGCKPVKKGDRIVSADPKTGLGADDRSGAAVVLTTVEEILRHKLPHPPLTLLWLVQEEVGLMGARYASLGQLGKPRMAFNFDGGSASKLTIGATGAYRIRIRIGGIAAHAGLEPEKGVNAITVAALAIERLHRDGWLGQVVKGRRRGTTNLGVINAGQATNVVTDEADLRAEVRSHNPAFRRKILGAFRKAFEESVAEVRSVDGRRGKLEFESSLDYESFALGKNDPCVEVAESAVRDLGGEPARAITDGGLDANWMNQHGIPTVTLGAGQRNVHTVDEWLELSEFRQACRVALRLATAI